MATIINKVKEKRNEKKLTQEDLANKVEVTRRTIISLEKRSYIPSLLLAMDIAEVLNMKIEDLFFKEESKNEKDYIWNNWKLNYD